MLIFGTFIKYTWRDTKSGNSIFMLKTEHNGVIRCHGISIPLSSHTPLKLEGYFTDKTDFKLKNLKLCGYNDTAIIQYLSKPEFRDIGKANAANLIGRTGSDIFEYVRNIESIDDATRKLGITSNAAEKALRKLKDQTNIEAALSYMLNLGGNYANALNIYKKLKDTTLQQIEKNPYIMLDAGISLYIIEKYAHKKGIKSYDKHRISALVNHMVSSNRHNGNTRMTFHDLVRRIHTFEKRQGIYNTDNIFIAEELTTKKYTVIEEDGEYYVYLSKDYTIETGIAFHLHRLHKSSAPKPFKEEYIDIAKKAIGVDYSDEQKEAFNLLKSSGVKIITGGPGTGKTSFLKGCINIYKQMNPHSNVTLCAPTGCAAARMKDSTEQPAQTLHKELGIIRGVQEAQKAITSDFIIVDEVSMVDANIFFTLLNATKNGATLLLVGDKDQLPSIGAGDILNDLINSGQIETYHFTKIFRQESGNSIIDNSISVIKGMPKLAEDKNFKIRRYSSEDQMLSDFNKICENIKSDYTVFTSTRQSKFKSGVVNLNKMISKRRRTTEDGVVYGYSTFCVGDRVIFTENNYEKKYYNGEIGVITGAKMINGSANVWVSAEGENIFLKDGDLSDLELGYAITAHKAQGSECDNAIIVISKNPKIMLRRKILYVEITRAKKGVLILTENDALEDCVRDSSEMKRNCGLQKEIQRAFA